MNQANKNVEFSQSGYTIKRGLISTKELESVRSEIYRLICFCIKSFRFDLSSEGQIEHLLADISGVDSELYLEICRAINQLPSVKSIATHAALLNQVRVLLRDELVLVYHHNVIVSSPAQNWALSHWHQDSYSSDLLHLVVNIPLVHTNASNGGIRVIHGGHLYGLLPHHQLLNEASHDRAHQCLVDPEAPFLIDKRQIVLSPGDAIFMDGDLPHAGNANLSHTARIVIAARYTSTLKAAQISRLQLG